MNMTHEVLNKFLFEEEKNGVEHNKENKGTIKILKKERKIIVISYPSICFMFRFGCKHLEVIFFIFLYLLTN